jgi:hypothetical protein
MHGFAFGKARAAPVRALLVRAGTVWMWPGIALTERRGADCVPVADEVARFWINIGEDALQSVPELFVPRDETAQNRIEARGHDIGVALPALKIGTGFLKISRECLEALIAAHPEWKARGHDSMQEDIKAKYYRIFRFAEDEFETGEDFVFCLAWAELGGEIWADPEMVIGDIGE